MKRRRRVGGSTDLSVAVVQTHVPPNILFSQSVRGPGNSASPTIAQPRSCRRATTNHDDVSVVGGSVPTVTSSLMSLINKYEGNIITARNNRFESPFTSSSGR